MSALGFDHAKHACVVRVPIFSLWSSHSLGGRPIFGKVRCTSLA